MQDRTWRRLKNTPAEFAEVHRTPLGHELRRQHTRWYLVTNRGHQVGENEVDHAGPAEPPIGWAQRELDKFFGAKR